MQAIAEEHASIVLSFDVESHVNSYKDLNIFLMINTRILNSVLITRNGERQSGLL